MAYADQSVSNRRIVALVIVGALHLFLGYALVTGLGMNYVKKTIADLKTFDVKDQPPPPPDKPPPPPPEQKQVEPPPMVTPPPIVAAPTIQAPIIQTVEHAPPPVITPAAPVAPPAPRVSQAASARGDEKQWVTADDYPPGALRDEKEGVVSVQWTIDTTGRMQNCHVTSSSGTPELDDTTCRVLTRRARYTPAKDQDGNPITQTKSRTVRWVLPKD